MLAGIYLENIETWGAYIGYRGEPSIEVRGSEHVTRALESGRGVILWRSAFCFSAVMESRAYAYAGLPVTLLRDRAHPYSNTNFGRRYLNPIRTRIEDRYLNGVVVLAPGGAADAMRQMADTLRRNEIIAVTAIGSGKNAISVPLLGGNLILARGVPSLAEVTGAPVIPTAVIRPSGQRYVVEFEPPLEVEADLAGSDFQKAMAGAYAQRLAPRLRSHPGSWRGWVMAHTWQP